MTSKDDIRMDGDDMYELDGFWFFLPITPVEQIAKIKAMDLCEGDVIVAGFPKSGNHWLLNILYAIQRADNLPAVERDGVKRRKSLLEDVAFDDEPQDFPRPNVFFTHCGYHMLPHGVQEKQNKVVYITRNPKDALISAYFFNEIFMPSEERKFTWEDYFARMFTDSAWSFTDWMRHVRHWLAYKDEPHVMFVEYEDLKKDPAPNIMKLGEFLGKKLTDEQVEKIIAMTALKHMQKNEEKFVHLTGQLDRSKGQFIRKGQVGDWKNHFTEEQNKKFDSFYEKFVAETGFRNKFEI